MSSPPTTTSRVAQTTVERAVTALLKWKEAQKSIQEKAQLIPEDDFVYLNLTLKKIPPKSRTNPYKIPLPHALYNPNTSELCLITDDRKSSASPSSESVKKVVKSQNIPVSKVLKLSKLKSNYKPFEAKRKLCDSYDLFLVDKRVVHLLPKLLGKEFFKKKKLPLGVDLGKKNLKEQIERICHSALLHMRSGTCCVVKVGRESMEAGEIVENVVKAIDGLIEVVPKKWGGVRSLHLKLSGSVALPLYQALPDVKLRIESAKEKENVTVVEEVRSESEGEGKVSEKKKKTKGRIHEVRYMDAGGIDDNDDDDDDDEEEEEEGNDDEENEVGMTEDDGEELKGKKGKKGNLVNKSQVHEDDEDLGNHELSGKKSKKGNLIKGGSLSESKGDKRVKKKGKLEKGEGGKRKKVELSSKDREESAANKKKPKKNNDGMKLEEGLANAKDKRRTRRA